MNLILTMAGKYTRFVNEGYKIPKYLLPWGNRSILSEILNQFVNTDKKFDNVYFIANENDKDFFPHLYKIQDDFGIDRKNLISISDTTGQAETAMSGIKNIKKNIQGPIIFHNIDTILYNRNIDDIKKHLLYDKGYIDIFSSNNHSYSYVLIDSDNYIKEISEKIVISNFATSGLYGFDSVSTFQKYYDGQNYISEIYKNMLQKNIKIVGGKVFSEKETIVLGTPFEYLKEAKSIK